MSTRHVKVLAFDGCPNIDRAWERARLAMSRTTGTAKLELVLIESDEHAQRARFLGSPSVRVDGVDVEPEAQRRDDYGLKCRIYAVDGRIDGAPPTDWIASALRGGTAGTATDPSDEPSRDLVSRPWARAAWLALALLAVVGIFVPALRAPLWITAFGVSGLLCVANAIRSRRFHCKYTGPIFLVGAAATGVRAVGLVPMPWSLIGAGVSLGVAGAIVWERARHDASTSHRCC